MTGRLYRFPYRTLGELRQTERQLVAELAEIRACIRAEEDALRGPQKARGPRPWHSPSPTVQNRGDRP